jgi:SAM-dependent methyltransferase|tara:strand:+ start:72 stop:1154 length:1083 start_codon:yes stop_codon:yes gene_type:complete
VKKTDSLLSKRFSSDYTTNIRKKNKLDIPISEVERSSHSHCPFCEGEEAWLISEVDRIGFPCDTVICKKCQYVFNDSFLIYPEKFYSEYWGLEHWGDPKENWNGRTQPDAYCWKRLAYVSMELGARFQELNNILEIGCGDGCNLLPYHLLGKQVLGCDFDDKYLSIGRQHGMNLITGGVQSIPKNKQFDLILLIHVFEHFIDLEKEIKTIDTLLNEDGFIYVEVPGLLNWNRKKSALIKEDGFCSSNNFLEYLQFQHNYHFDMLHLSSLWNKNGFNAICCDEWVRIIFQKKNGETNFLNGDKSSTDVLSYLQEIEEDYNPTLLNTRKKQLLSPRFIAAQIKRGLLNSIKSFPKVNQDLSN